MSNLFINVSKNAMQLIIVDLKSKENEYRNANLSQKGRSVIKEVKFN